MKTLEPDTYQERKRKAEAGYGVWVIQKQSVYGGAVESVDLYAFKSKDKAEKAAAEMRKRATQRTEYYVLTWVELVDRD